MSTCRLNHPLLPLLRRFRYAHRGLHDLAAGVPENTMPAFRRAVEHGFGAELDVHLTRDGRLVVIHDSDLRRLCGADRRADTLTAAAFAELPILGTAEHAPMLEDVLPLFEGRTPLIIEIKTDGGNAAPLTGAVCAMLDRFQVTYCIESFDPRVLIWLRQHRPEICRGQLSCDFDHDPDCGLSVPVRYALTRLQGNVLTRPDFIAYKYADRNEPALRRCLLSGVQEVSWTLRREADLLAAEREGSIGIFEHFIPDPKPISKR